MACLSPVRGVYLIALLLIVNLVGFLSFQSTAKGMDNFTSSYHPLDSPTVERLVITLSEDSFGEISASDIENAISCPDSTDVVTIDSLELLTMPSSGVLVTQPLAGDTTGIGNVLPFSDLFSLTYIPNPDFSGLDSVQWKVYLDSGRLVQESVLLFDVESVNDLPGPFEFYDLSVDTFYWSGQLIDISWSDAHDVDGDALSYTWTLNLRDTVISQSVGTDTSIVYQLDPELVHDEVYLMWVDVTDGKAAVRGPRAIFKPTVAVTGLVDDVDDLNWDIFPVPVNNKLTLVTPMSFEQGEIRLLTLEGRELTELRFGDVSQGSSLEIPVRNELVINRQVAVLYILAKTYEGATVQHTRLVIFDQ